MIYCPGADVLSLPQLQCVLRHQLAGVRVRVLADVNVSEAHWTLKQSFGGRKQPYAIRIILGWIVLGPLDRGASNARNMNHIEAKVDPLKKKLDLP